MASVDVENLERHYGALQALKGVSFHVEDGEFLTLLGPSGCGKSTTLAAIAGLDRPTSGRIRVGERVLFDGASGVFVDAQFRNLGLMFQSYALWPHMTVYQNLDFTLELRRVRGPTARRMILDTLALVDMQDYADRYPGELSGGQQQRVALARTLVYGPEILLLDEPLSNLDAKLRERARVWLGELQRQSRVTTIYVTHDQSEALAMSDQVIVMDGGRIAQIGTPEDIYERPRSEFVADFVGGSNLLDAELSPDRMRLDLPGGVALALAEPPEAGPGRVRFSIRPERARFPRAGEAADNRVRVDVRSKSYLGARSQVTVGLGPQVLRVETRRPVGSGEVEIDLPAAAITVFPPP